MTTDVRLRGESGRQHYGAELAWPVFVSHSSSAATTGAV
jgi:hypothetical protein